MDTVELKPCPFCKEKACAEIDNVGKALKIYCENCPAEMRVTYEEANLGDGSLISFDEAIVWMDYLIARWNVRVRG